MSPDLVILTEEQIDAFAGGAPPSSCGMDYEEAIKSLARLVRDQRILIAARNLAVLDQATELARRGQELTRLRGEVLKLSAINANLHGDTIVCDRERDAIEEDRDELLSIVQVVADRSPSDGACKCDWCGADLHGVRVVEEHATDCAWAAAVKRQEIGATKQPKPSKLAALAARCKAGLEITVNGHRTYYQTAAQAIAEEKATAAAANQGHAFEDVDEATQRAMVEKDQIVRVQAYTQTPVGFFLVLHHDVDQAIAKMLAHAESE